VPGENTLTANACERILKRLALRRARELPMAQPDCQTDLSSPAFSGQRAAPTAAAAPVSTRNLLILADLVRQVCGPALATGTVEVLLFGSWAKGTANANSDIDLAFGGLVPRGLLGRLAEAIDDSRILCRVDLVDLGRASAAIRASVAQGGIPWPI